MDSDLSSGRPVTSGASAPIGAHSAAVGIAGVNTRPLMRAADPMVGIAGNWDSTLRPHVVRLTEPGASISKSRIGDQAALHAPKRACYFLDYTYLTVGCYTSGHSQSCVPLTLVTSTSSSSFARSARRPGVARPRRRGSHVLSPASASGDFAIPGTTGICFGSVTGPPDDPSPSASPGCHTRSPRSEQSFRPHSEAS